jgi:hypothetical protein
MNRKRALFLGGVFFLAGFVWAGSFLISTDNPALDELEHQQKIWVDSGLNHYLLQVDDVPDEDTSYRCTWEREVINEETLIELDRECAYKIEVDGNLVGVSAYDAVELNSAKTVSEIFHILEMRMLEKKCGPNGCNCDGYYDFEIDYHPQYGYPTRIQEVMQLDRNLEDGLECISTIGIKGLRAYLRTSRTCRPCTLSGYSIHQYNISVTPLP